MNKLTEEEAHTVLTSMLIMTDTINKFSVSSRDDLNQLQKIIDGIEGELASAKERNEKSLSGDDEEYQVFYDLHYAIENYAYASTKKLKEGAYLLNK